MTITSYGTQDAPAPPTARASRSTAVIEYVANASRPAAAVSASASESESESECAARRVMSTEHGRAERAADGLAHGAFCLGRQELGQLVRLQCERSLGRGAGIALGADEQRGEQHGADADQHEV